MKINKIKRYNLINYNLLKSRSYLGLQKLSFYYLNSSYILGFRKNFSLFNLKYTKNYIKKSLLIIYKFHYYNKKILFIGFPSFSTGNKNYDLLFYSTDHYHVAYDNWINNFLMNYKQIMLLTKKLLLKKNLNNKELKTVIGIKQIPDLIVVYNQTKQTKDKQSRKQKQNKQASWQASKQASKQTNKHNTTTKKQKQKQTKTKTKQTKQTTTTTTTKI